MSGNCHAGHLGNYGGDEMRRGDIVKFREVKDPGDGNTRMELLEDPANNGRVLVRHLINMTIQPTSIYYVEDLERCVS